MKHIFLINPKAGKENVFTKVRAYLQTRQDIEPLVFNTEFRGHETELTKRLCGIFDDEPVRFYACGGSGTFCRLISGIADLSSTEVAWFPCGMTNDFLKVFHGGAASFSDLGSLIDGVPFPVDIMDFGFCRGINFSSSGYEAKISSDVNDLASLSIVGQKLPYYMAILKNLLTKTNLPYQVTIDGHAFDGRYSLVSALNGVCYGGTFSPLPDILPNDGLMSVILYEFKSALALAKGMPSYKNGRLDQIGEAIRVVEGKELAVTVPVGQTHYFAVDGEVFSLAGDPPRYLLRLLPAALRLIVPRGTTLKSKSGGGKRNAS